MRNSMIALRDDERVRLREWRAEVISQDHVLNSDRMRAIEEEVVAFPYMSALTPDAKFFESFDVLTSNGEKTGTRTWRGLAHWLWLRHGCVHGMLFSGRTVILQRRAASVEDSPGLLDMSFAGHMGVAELRAAVGSKDRQALESEAWEEAGVDLFQGSRHIIDAADLNPICNYNYVEPPRPADEFYNCEIRYVFAIRLSPVALRALEARDGEVESFLLMQVRDVRDAIRDDTVASALRVSGPLALDHAVKTWEWGE
jgi:isopentenyldiphosphate isomerase